MQRDKDQVRKVINVALEVSYDASVPLVDRITRLRAARCLAEEAGIKEWLDVLDERIEGGVEPRFIQCPVCDGKDTLNVNAKASGAVDLCVRCGTDIHSDAVFYGAGCPTCGACYCYCEAKAGWKKTEVTRG